jgi:hypothetical protein
VVDYFTGVDALSNILANDRLGDCTAAGACHIVEAVTAASQLDVVLEEGDAIDFYEQSTGYNPADPSTDQGGDEITVLTSWRDKGIGGKHKITGWLSVDEKNVALIRSILAVFGPVLYFGVELVDSYMALAKPGGFVWDVGMPDPSDGHCIVGVGANDAGVQIDTWGLIGTFTYAAVAELCSEANGGNLFAVLSPEIISAAKATAPDGMNWTALEAAFVATGGTVGP